MLEEVLMVQTVMSFILLSRNAFSGVIRPRTIVSLTVRGRRGLYRIGQIAGRAEKRICFLGGGKQSVRSTLLTGKS